jgi:hypothetical protein
VISVRRSGLGIVGVVGLAFGGLVFGFAGTASAVEVSTEAELRAAFADFGETSIRLPTTSRS